MRVIGRKTEQEILYNCDRSHKSELVCIYGRRRVGKTYLVEQTFPRCFAFRATGVESGNTRTQLKSFHQRLRACGDPVKTIPTDWFEAFARLETILDDKNVIRSAYGKRIVFLDEFPWFATARSDFLPAFGEFWNRYGTADGDLMVIICGSATSWIIGNLIENTGSLFDRVTCQLFLQPFSLKNTEKYFQDRDFGWSRTQIAECQMIFGGLPYFFDLLNKNESLAWNIDQLLFRPNSLLRQESKRLLEATLKKSERYEQILQLLAAHQYGMERSDCKRELGIADSSFSRAVDDLKKCGYISEQRARYRKNHPLWLRLIDPFLLFHYQFISETSTNVISSYSAFRRDMGRYTNWRGHAFENLCLYHVAEIKGAMGISGLETQEYSWTSEENAAQIDIVIDRQDQVINLCEAKYTDDPFTIDAEYEQSLIRKMKLFQNETGTKSALRLVLISAMGLGGVAHTEHVSKVITLDDLFEA